MNTPIFPRRTGLVATAWFAGLVLALVAVAARAEDPKAAVTAAVEKLRAAGNYSWSVTTVPGADDASPRYFVFPAVRGKTAGDSAYLSARSDDGEVGLLKKAGRKAARIRIQWKTPEEIRAEWLKANAAAALAVSTNPAAGTEHPAPSNPVDAAGFLLGNDPTVVAGGIAPLQATTRLQRGKAVIKAPPPGATLHTDASTLTPIVELPSQAAMTVMALDAAPDPLAQIDAILAAASNFKIVGGGYYAADVSSDFALSLALTRKLVGDSRPPQVNDAKLTARFWVGQGSLSKVQIVVQATITVGPPYNPLELYVDRTLTMVIHAAGATRVEIPPAAAKLLE
jgi:hypothetical protein